MSTTSSKKTTSAEKPRGLLAGAFSKSKRKDRLSANNDDKSNGQESRTSNSNNSNGYNRNEPVLLLPRLPSLEDFDFSLPFLSDESESSSTPATIATTTFTSSPSSPASSYSHSTSRPLLPGASYSSFSPSNSQYFTSQSSRVQDYFGPSSPAPTIRQRSIAVSQPPTSSGSTQSNNSNQSLINNSRPTTSLHSKAMTATTISGTGTISTPLDLSRLEVSSNNYIHDDDDLASKRSSLKDSQSVHSRIDPIHIFSNSNINSVNTIDQRGRSQQQDQQQRGDLLNPPRFVIRQPSLTALSKATREASPSPSLTSSVRSEESSVRSSLQHHAQPIQQLQLQHQLRSGPSSRASVESSPQRPQIHQQQQEKRPASTASAADSATRSSSIMLSTHAQTQAASTAEKSISNSNITSKAVTAQTKTVKSHTKGGPSPNPSPTFSAAQTRPAQSKQVLNTLHESQSPNLRTRISRLFRQNPKSELPSSSLKSRQRVQQQQLNQDRSQTLPRTKHQQPFPRQQQQQQQQQKQLQGSSLPQKQQDQPPVLQPLQVPVLHASSEQKSKVSTTPKSVDIPTSTLTSQQPKKISAIDVPAIFIPPTSFAPGIIPSSISPPASPLSSQAAKARQRRVSSVSSSHSIRQIGTFGGGSRVPPNKMISPARKANPYYSGVIARFSNGGRHSPHDRELSSSRRRSVVAVSERARVGVEATSSRDKLTTAEAIEQEPTKPVLAKPRPQSTASTVSSIVSEVKEREPLPPLPSHQESTEDSYDEHDATSQSSIVSSPVERPLMFTAAYEEEYDIEKDSIRFSVQGSPFTPDPLLPFTGNIPVSNGPSAFSSSSPSPPPTRIVPIPPVINTNFTAGDVQRMDEPQSADDYAPSSTSDDAQLDSPTSQYTSREGYGEHGGGIITTEDNWDEESQQDSLKQDVPPIVMVHRPSIEISILPEQPPFAQNVRPLSSASSIMSSSSNKMIDPSPVRLTSVAQWSESSYDPCAPIRWDELFEMDPNSKGPLWLSNRQLGQIPHEFFDGLRNLRELYLDHNDIKVVPDSLLKLTKLDVLDLSCNSISSFHSAFKMKKLKNLRRLNLDHNMLTDISPIYKLKSLRELRMNHNFIPFLAIAIQNMTKLKILAIESNSLTTLPESMGKLGNLCELRLSDNRLRALPDSIGSIRTLQVLALRSNFLERLPESWKDMENLSTLDLASNRLTSLPADIVRLPKLTHLDLHDNRINALPDKIGQLSNLVVLQLCNNQLKELPRDIGRLKDLHDLVLSFNQLRKLPDEIGKLNKLQELKFDNNPLRSLPKTIQRLTNVRRVYLQGCELHDLPVELGVAFKELVYLDLSGNRFEVMPALDQMTRLEELYISNNMLREIGTSSLNLQTSSITSSNYNTGTISGPMSGGLGLANNSQIGNGSHSSQTGSGNSSQAGTIAVNSSTGHSSIGSMSGTFSKGGGVTASKLSELKRLRVFEAANNQIRVLSHNIMMLSRLEVLDLSDNLLTWLPKEVGDLADLKVLILEGNPIKSLPSSLSKLMGSLEVFRIGEWPENGFEIIREQSQINMKINVLQTFLPQQIERTLLMRMHDSILKRVQELDSQRYRDEHDLDKVTGSGLHSRALTGSSHRTPGASFALATNVVNMMQQARSDSLQLEEVRNRHGITQGLAIATQNMLAHRDFSLPTTSPGIENQVTFNAGTAYYSTSSAMLSTNSEGINLNYGDYSNTTTRTLPTLQFSSFRGHSAPITSTPLTTSPLTASVPSGPLSAFPLLNSLRTRKSHQNLSAKNSSTTGSRPKSMYTYGLMDSPQDDTLSPQTSSLSNRMSRVFDFSGSSSNSGGNGGNSKQKNGSGAPKISTLESSTLQLSTDAMMALGLGSQPGTAGSAITRNHGFDRLGLGHSDGSRLGDGSLADLKNSMAIKSSPSLSSTPMPLLSTRATSPFPGSSSSKPERSRSTKTSFARPVSPLPSHISDSSVKSPSSSIGGGFGNEKTTTTLPWLRLKSSSIPQSYSQDSGYQQPIGDFPPPTASIASTVTSMSTTSLLAQPNVNGMPISAPTPPPILLDYNLETSALDIPSHMYYSAGGDDVDGDMPTGTENDDDELSRLDESMVHDGETEDDSMSTTTGGYTEGTRPRIRTKAHLVESQSRSQHGASQYQYQQPQPYQATATDPVLKIAVLKGIYDQILQNMDHMVEQNVQESPAKKNSHSNKFKLLNTLKFLKADRNGGGSNNSGNHHSHHPSMQAQHHNHHQGSLTSSLVGHHPITTTLQ
ncbi:hypothetical protein FBU30_004971 [Linnemannia zychae]|nr:hypothetical protein FBU30_004971 [Linnemannia zychae]